MVKSPGPSVRKGMLPKEENMAKLTKPARDRISTTKFAFPKQRKEPLENASHVRNAVARFNQVKGVTEVERRAAWKRIQSAAKRFGVEVQESE
jgi:cell division protein FtsX